LKQTSAAKKLRNPGFDGTKVSKVSVRVSSNRTTKQSVRAMPGTFEWRYGRGGPGMYLYHAGSHYARLWEQAGTASASSPDLNGTSGAGWKGIPEKRLEAMEELKGAAAVLGALVSARLTAYCAQGLTAKQIGLKFEINERDVAPVLEQDLVACAKCFGYK